MSPLLLYEGKMDIRLVSLIGIGINIDRLVDMLHTSILIVSSIRPLLVTNELEITMNVKI